LGTGLTLFITASNHMPIVPPSRQAEIQSHQPGAKGKSIHTQNSGRKSRPYDFITKEDQTKQTVRRLLWFRGSSTLGLTLFSSLLDVIEAVTEAR
jgi:hypothetical protein